MDLGPFLLLGFMWLVVNALRKAGSKPPGAPRTPPRPGSSVPRAPRPGGVRPPGTGPAGPSSSRPPIGARHEPSTPLPGVPPVAGDATQREGLRLEALLRELGRTLDQASGPLGRAPDRRLPGAREVEERESLEATPEVRSLETVPQRGERAVVDQDDEAERLVARRRAAAEANAAPLTGADHRTFDARIRQEPADKTATRAYTPEQLRKAVVWQEILGAPVSMRREDGE